MPGNEADKGPDGTSIKTVSSLLSHFEGLKGLQPPQNGDSTPKESPRYPRVGERVDGVQPPGITRASLDFPRPESPWNASLAPTSVGIDTPRTPLMGPARPGSPPKSSQKRPMSMNLTSTPSLTPSVTVDSPRSPPTGYFAIRNLSSSPERSINTMSVGKVQDLISQHSSRSSTRASTPRLENSDHPPSEGGSGTAQNLPGTSHQLVPKSNSVPPPINRAEKPKIPAKPTPLYAQDLTGLVSEQRKPSNEKKVSPFSTPPDSEGSASPERPPVTKPDSTLGEGAGLNDSLRHSVHMLGASLIPQQPTNSKDPRSMGFQMPAPIVERRDPRSMGLAQLAAKPPSRERSTTPVRANTVSERPVARDAREFGFAAPKAAQRHVSETIRPMPAPALTSRPSNSPYTPPRDPRLFGFANQPVTTAEPESLPGLPPRRAPTEPPPRPSEESKRLSTTGRNQFPALIPHDRVTKAVKTGQQVPHLPPVDTTINFPPPPKRNTAAGSETPHSQEFLSSATGSIWSPMPVENSRQPGIIEEDSEGEEITGEPATIRTDYPDSSQTNRRAPYFSSGLRELPTKHDVRVFDVCGQFICTSGYTTRVWDLTTGEQIMNMSHGETVKVISVAFKPTEQLGNEGSRLWIGNNIGELHEIDVATQSDMMSSTAHGRREIVRILRHKKDLWTLDDEGKLFVWHADESGVPSLKYSHQAHKIQKGHTFSMVVQDKLWIASGKELRVYRPGNDASLSVLQRPLIQQGTGDITSGASTSLQDGRAYFGHTDGKVTIYSTKDFTCIGSVKASDYKINALAFVGDWLWAAYKTGKIYVYDTSSTPWKVKKDWIAHDGPATGMVIDPRSVWTLQRLQVTSVGHDNFVRLWDGMLEEDWFETTMQSRDAEYCTFRDISASVVTWNAGAINPFDLRSDFISDAIHVENPPELLVFGFQEVVDLEDRAVTAKSILGFGKKKEKDSTKMENVSRVYREWRDYLTKCINRTVDPRYSYSELHTSSMIGLFQCIFVRQEERPNIRNLSATDVKCGMKGHYGNKGALITRFVLDDSSLCFVNCHLAAGQAQTSHRNNDIATILEAESLPLEQNSDIRTSLFVGGGDGTQILDHEICVLNGDLNYRIDMIPRDTVINMIKKNELNKLLERDQIMVSRRRVSGFRLGPFTEMPITFRPTYKYDVGKDDYDSSEKKRSPAWCDRLLYRGPGRIRQTEYRRHEVRASDHRPVSGMFKFKIKTIDEGLRQRVKDDCHKMFADVQRRLAAGASIDYLVNGFGLNEKEARALIAKG